MTTQSVYKKGKLVGERTTRRLPNGDRETKQQKVTLSPWTLSRVYHPNTTTTRITKRRG